MRPHGPLPAAARPRGRTRRVRRLAGFWQGDRCRSPPYREHKKTAARRRRSTLFYRSVECRLSGCPPRPSAGRSETLLPCARLTKSVATLMTASPPTSMPHEAVRPRIPHATAPMISARFKAMVPNWALGICCASTSDARSKRLDSASSNASAFSVTRSCISMDLSAQLTIFSWTGSGYILNSSGGGSTPLQ